MLDLLNTPLRRLRKLADDEGVQTQLANLFGRTLEEKITCLRLGITSTPSCEHCSKPISAFPHSVRGYPKYCSKTCSAKETAVANLEKRSATMLKRYGVATTLESLELRAKAEETMVKRYGGGLGSAKPVRERIEKTNIVRYGGKSPAASQAIAAKSSALKISRAAQAHQAAIEALGFSFDQPLTSIHDAATLTHTCGTSFSFQLSTIQRYPLCPKCHQVPGASQAEQEIGKFVDDLGFQTIRRAKIGEPKFEVDILIPSKSLAIEYHGLYWHSVEVGTAPTKHADKLSKANAVGIDLIQIFEDEWLLKKEIVQSVLRHKLGVTPSKIYARACKVVEVPTKKAHAFFEQTHLAGSARMTKAFGLEHQGELIACASIAPSRYKKGGYELIRFSTKLNTAVIGGLSRILKMLPRPLLTYCDSRFGTGRGYVASGFTDAGSTKPGFWYFKTAASGRIHRSMLQKKKLMELTGLSDLNTGKQLAQKAGYSTIYDAGHRRFTLG